MSPERYEYVMETLLDKGARDVYLTNILMKKNRPGVKLTVLYDEDIEKEIETTIFKHTTSIGVRKYDADRTVLRREMKVVSTKYGDVRVKFSYYDGGMKFKAEYDDCKKIAITKNLSIQEVVSEVESSILQ